MNENIEEKMLMYEISDAALEIAAGIVKAGTVSLTVAFCSGLDYCQPEVAARPPARTCWALTRPRI